MRKVYSASHINEAMAFRQGDVAIKLIHSQVAQQPERRDRFITETSIGLKLTHSGIIRVFDLMQKQNQLGLVMEFVYGRSLSTLIGSEVPIPWPLVREYFFKIIDAVEYAHKNGVVHRDIKPENIMVLKNGDIKILDFGIAKDVEEGKTKTSL